VSFYLIDTDTFQLLQDQQPSVVARVSLVPPAELAISVITVEEQMSGWYTQLRQAKDQERLCWAYRLLARTVRSFAKIQIVDFDEQAIHRYEQLKKLKLKIGKMDLRIASTALERDATVVTRNTKDFRQVPGLRVEDWSK
jgi:tRNA(fMet)-specific endonuclease VapC